MNIKPNPVINCPSCPKTFFSSAKYNRHEKTHTRPYRCDSCDKAFALSADLRRHKTSHGSVEEKYKCRWPDCKFKGTLRKDNLRKHMRLVHKPKEAEEDLEEFQALYGESISHQRQAMTDSPLLSALLIAARNGSVWTVGRLIAKGAPLAESTADGKTVLHAAAMSGSEQLTRLLIDAGVDCSRQDNNGNSALHDAAAQGHAGVIRVLAKAGIPLSIANKRGETALHLAVARSCEASTRNLLEHGANPDTPKILCRAAEKGVERIAKLLIQGGTPIETQGGSALQVASRTGHIGVVKLMLDQGVPLNLNYKGQGTALYHASIAGHKKVVKLLLTQGAVEYERERGGRHGTALLAALAEGHHKVAELIMSQPEHHFARELAEELDAALAEALSRGHDKIVELLLVKGTHIISLRTFVGVLEMASALGHERIIDVLPTRVVCEGKTVIASTIRSENDGKFTVHCSNATVSYYQKMTKAKGRLGILPLPYIDARKAAGLFDLDRPCSDGKWIQPDTVRKVTKGRHDNTIAKIICNSPSSDPQDVTMPDRPVQAYITSKGKTRQVAIAPQWTEDALVGDAHWTFGLSSL